MELYRHLKKTIYIFETLFGVFLLMLANSMIKDGYPVSWLVAIILYITGLACCVFGAATFRLRSDPDIWR
jgi:hypothetical protein